MTKACGGAADTAARTDSRCRVLEWGRCRDGESCNIRSAFTEHPKRHGSGLCRPAATRLGPWVKVGPAGRWAGGNRAGWARGLFCLLNRGRHCETSLGGAHDARSILAQRCDASVDLASALVEAVDDAEGAAVDGLGLHSRGLRKSSDIIEALVDHIFEMGAFLLKAAEALVDVVEVFAGAFSNQMRRMVLRDMQMHLISNAANRLREFLMPPISDLS